MNELKKTLAEKTKLEPNPQNIYALCRIIAATKPYSALELKKMEGEEKKEISPQERETILKEALESVYGIKQNR